MEQFSYFIPPNYPETLWPEVDAAIMFRIQDLKTSLEIEQCIVNNRLTYANMSGNRFINWVREILGYAPELLSSLQRSSASFPISFLHRVFCHLMIVRILFLICVIAAAYTLSQLQ